MDIFGSKTCTSHCNLICSSLTFKEEFFDLYKKTRELLQPMLGTTDESIVILSGEGMVALWAGLKSVLLPGDGNQSIIEF